MNNIEKRKAQLLYILFFFSDSATVAFVAELTNSIVNPPAKFHIVFDNILLNKGNAYNSRHGLFIAKVPGIYHFAVEITSPPQSLAGHMMHILIMKNDKPFAVTFLDSNTHQYLRRTGSILLELAVGDDVWCQTDQMNGQNTIFGENTYSMFSGFLLKSL